VAWKNEFGPHPDSPARLGIHALPAASTFLFFFFWKDCGPTGYPYVLIRNEGLSTNKKPM
jgi:hypothetical protein